MNKPGDRVVDKSGTEWTVLSCMTTPTGSYEIRLWREGLSEPFTMISSVPLKTTEDQAVQVFKDAGMLEPWERTMIKNRETLIERLGSDEYYARAERLGKGYLR